MISNILPDNDLVRWLLIAVVAVVLIRNFEPAGELAAKGWTWAQGMIFGGTA